LNFGAGARSAKVPTVRVSKKGKGKDIGRASEGGRNVGRVRFSLLLFDFLLRYRFSPYSDCRFTCFPALPVGYLILPIRASFQIPNFIRVNVSDGLCSHSVMTTTALRIAHTYDFSKRSVRTFQACATIGPLPGCCPPSYCLVPWLTPAIIDAGTAPSFHPREHGLSLSAH
jgi:hypothetical protein